MSMRRLDRYRCSSMEKLHTDLKKKKKIDTEIKSPYDHLTVSEVILFLIDTQTLTYNLY